MRLFQGTFEELKEVRTREVLQYLTLDDEFRKGLNKTDKQFMSMTDATVAYYGTSGKGSHIAKAHISLVAKLGYLSITRKGRAEYVSVTEKGWEKLKSLPKEL